MCTVAMELNLLDLAPLLHDDFLWLKAKKIPLYLSSTTAVSALRYLLLHVFSANTSHEILRLVSLLVGA